MPFSEKHTFAIEQAVELLNRDQVVGLPTETVYGLAGAIDSKIALRKIFTLKERPFFDPLIVHISDFSQIEPLINCNVDHMIRTLAQKFWPGPLTIIFYKSDLVNPLITSGLETVAIRIPNHPIALEVIRRLGKPIAMPSANKFSKTSPTSAEHVIESFRGSDLFVLDGGASKIGLESTVIRIKGKDKDVNIEILRPGFITKDDIHQAIPGIKTINYLNSISSPGNIEHHYMPEKPLIIVDQHISKISPEFLTQTCSRLNTSFSKPMFLTLNQNPQIAARELYSKLRDADNLDIDVIFIPKPPSQEGLWAAIWDRLNKAKTLNLTLP